MGDGDSSVMARKKVRPLDAEVFELAEKVALIFDRPEAVLLREKLCRESLAYRDRLRPHESRDRWATPSVGAA
jgi:hypothetical protein